MDQQQGWLDEIRNLHDAMKKVAGFDEKAGQVVLFMRKAKNWTQAELADRLGVTDSYLSKLEHGERVPSDDVKRKLIVLALGEQAD